MTELRIEHVSRTFLARHGNAPTRALEPTDLIVGNNDFVTILGPSGCGKSTLLRISADERPCPARWTRSRRTRRGSRHGAPVLRAVPLVDRAREYRVRPARTGPLRIGARQNRRRFIERVGLSGFERHWPKQLSGGMQQRAAIARALANDPKILLIDEPLGALDNQTRMLMQEMLLGIWKHDRKTVLFVTHDIEEAIFLGSRVIVMSARPHQGRDRDRPPAPVILQGQNRAQICQTEGAACRGNPRRGIEGRRTSVTGLLERRDLCDVKIRPVDNADGSKCRAVFCFLAVAVCSAAYR